MNFSLGPKKFMQSKSFRMNLYKALCCKAYRLESKTCSAIMAGAGFVIPDLIVAIFFG